MYSTKLLSRRPTPNDILTHLNYTDNSPWAILRGWSPSKRELTPLDVSSYAACDESTFEGLKRGHNWGQIISDIYT